jgi:hypothetical protein
VSSMKSEGRGWLQPANEAIPITPPMQDIQKSEFLPSRMTLWARDIL